MGYVNSLEGTFLGAPNVKPQIGVRFGCRAGTKKVTTNKLVSWADRLPKFQWAEICRLFRFGGVWHMWCFHGQHGFRDQQIQHMASWTYNYLHGKLQRTFRGNEIESIQRCLFVLTYHWQYFFPLRHTESSERHGLLGGLFWLHLNSYPHTGNIWKYPSVIKIKTIQFQCSHHPSVLPKVIQRNIMNIVLCCAQTGGIQHNFFSKIVPAKGR